MFQLFCVLIAEAYSFPCEYVCGLRNVFPTMAFLQKQNISSWNEQLRNNWNEMNRKPSGNF